MDTLQQLYEKLATLSSKSESDLKDLVKKKVEELSGLVSEEGAVYIVANELGVKLEGKPPGSSSGGAEYKRIEEIIEAKVSLNLVAKVLRKYDLVEFQSKSGSSGKVQSLLVGDDTGIIRIVFWGEKTEMLSEHVDRDTIVDVKNCYVRENTNTSRMEIHFGEYSELELNPEGVSIDVKEVKPESTLKDIQDIEAEDRNVGIKATIVDIDIPRFYLGCPHTFKKVFVDEGKYISPEHGEVEPIKVPITNVVVSDSTGTIGIVAFRNRAEELFSKSSEDIVNLAEDLEGYREISKSMVGSQVHVSGNVSENQMTGELQLIVNDVVLAPKKSEDEVAEDIANDLNKEKTEPAPIQEELVDLDDDLDIEEIDIDDDLL